MAQNPFVFIVGCPRSGTTMLRRIFNAHPQIAVTPETHWIPRYLKEGDGVTDDGFVTKVFITKLTAYRRFKRMKIERSQLEELFGHDEELPYARFVTAIFDLYGQSQKKKLVGDKTPSYLGNIDTLHSLWPAARFIHLIRDGRDVCLSLLNWRKSESMMRAFTTTWSEDPVVTAALFWKWRVQLGRQKSTSIPAGLYTEVRYETLVADPEAECKRLCHFLSIRYDDAMLEFHEGKTRTQPDLTANSAWLPVTPGLRDWRTQMPPEQIELFEATSGDLLDELAYSRSFPKPSSHKLDQASRIYESFTRDLQSRKRLLPNEW